jgi:chromosome partitioning protein
MSYIDIRAAAKSMYDVFVDRDTRLADVILPASQKNLSIAPARIALAKLEQRLSGELDAPVKLKDELAQGSGRAAARVAPGIVPQGARSFTSASMSAWEGTGST